MIIKVKMRHIQNGTPKYYSCPIALAIKEQTDFKNIAVLDSHIEYDERKYPLSRSAQRFIKNFDAGKKVKPFNFKLDIKVKPFNFKLDI